MAREGPETATAVPAEGRPALTKQASQRTMVNCLCSPTTHAGSFRCRLHRTASFKRRAGSVGSGLSAYAAEPDSPKLADQPAAGSAAAASAKG
ncbi:uncharacterized protein LOC144703811 [Wolffia australiana]